MKFALVVPAFNEEEAIGATLRRCLAARQKVLDATTVSEMVVVFVNDGSTDGTQQVVDSSEFDEVVKVHFPRNRGYGAAIKAGWQATNADLVGFIDGDGTCEPDFCIQLISRLIETDADAVLAARLNAQSKMPMIRRFGNTLFAWLLGVVSGNDLTDTASGFRVVKRSSLCLISPLPDGLHFTPAMSCIILLDPRLRIEEVSMPYEERIGRSKLNVIKDGARFLYTILFSACCYAPLKTMLGVSVLTALVAFMASWVLMSAGSTFAAVYCVVAAAVIIAMLLTTGVICHQLNFLLIGPRSSIGPAERCLQWILDYKRLIIGGIAATAAGAVAGVVVGMLHDAMSDSVLIVLLTVLAVCVIAASASMLLGVILRVVWSVGEKQKSLAHDRYPVRTTQELSHAFEKDQTVAQVLGDSTQLTMPPQSQVNMVNAAKDMDALGTNY